MFEWNPWPEITPKLAPILESWRWTPYMEGQRCKGVGVDCVRFVCAVLDELAGTERSSDVPWPQDGGWHNREGSMRALRYLKRLYAPSIKVVNSQVRPADVVVYAPQGGGAAHVAIVGHQRNTLWHADKMMGVQFSGLDIGMKPIRVYRTGDPQAWF